MPRIIEIYGLSIKSLIIIPPAGNSSSTVIIILLVIHCAPFYGINTSNTSLPTYSAGNLSIQPLI